MLVLRANHQSLPTLKATCQWLWVARMYLPYYLPYLFRSPREPSGHWCSPAPSLSHSPDSSNTSYRTEHFWAFLTIWLPGTWKVFRVLIRRWKRKKSMYVSAVDPDRHLSIFNLKSTPFPDPLAVFIDSYHTNPRSTALKLLLWPRADPLLTLLKVRGTAPGYHSVISSSADKSKPWNPASSCKHPLILSFLGR